MSLNLPSGTVTFLFTDIEGSSQLWEQQPAAMQAALARHDQLLRDLVAAHGGSVFKTTGDGLHAVFAHASGGVAAALASQLALAGETWPGLPRPVRVRMCLHTGEAELREGDYFGPSLNRAARLLSIAWGGQTLLSTATAELVRDQLPPGAALQPLGEHRLKDLVRPEPVFQLDAPGLPAAFPPLRSLNTLPHNLPVQVTSFIGREHELAEVKRLLATTRLLTLTGPGGTGKTRLSLQAAVELLDTFPDGVWLVEFAALTDPTLVLQTLAAALGVREQPGRPLLDTVADYLRGKNLLIILDNCEHLIDACAQLAAALLQACPRLKILPSSREALGIAGETAYRVPSLSLPDPHRPLTMESLSRYEAAQLFVARAQAAQPSFALTANNLRAVAQICQRLDGIPLALELAAARTRLLSVVQIAERLDDRFRLLTGGSRTALPRQQTLRALIDWSYDLLPAAERAALARLSVFAGGWTFEAAEAVIGPEALNRLSHLVDKSLVVVDDLAEAPERRYRLLETIRQYARDKLLESGEAPEARELHKEHTLRFTETVEPMLEGPELLTGLNQLEADLDNIRAAMEWTLDRHPEDALRLAASLTYFWQRRGALLEGRRWLRDGLARLDALPPAAGAAAHERLTLRAKALWGAGTMAWALGELNDARSYLEEGVALARAADAPEILMRMLGMLGFTAVWLGDGARAEAAIDEGSRVAQAINSRFGQAMMLSVQAAAAIQLRGDYAAGLRYSEASVQFLRELGSPWIAAFTIVALGNAAAQQGHYAEARARLAESETLFRQIGDRQMVNASISEQAHVERQLGNHAQAMALYAQTIKGWQELGHRAALAHELECCAFIACAQADGLRAARLFGAAEALRASANAPMAGQERGEYEQNLAALRGLLDAAALQAAWAEGRAMAPDEAVAYAVGGGAWGY
jgi:predicted ATPase/class 3 adenylate cyclase